MKKNMRKVAALGLCVALGATMLTACGGSKGKSASGGKTELNFGIWDENQRQQQMRCSRVDSLQ